jgi:hypothetical protein
VLTMSSLSYQNLPNEVSPVGQRRWIPIKDSPLSRAATYEAIALGWWDSSIVQFPGSKMKRRFIDALSIDRHFENLLVAQQQAAKETPEVGG